MKTPNANLYTSSSLTTLMAAATLALASPAIAAPQGGTVAHGNVAIQQSGGNTTIDQSSQNAIINWDSFNADAGDNTYVNQLNRSSHLLNHVTGNGATHYDGGLFANGNVWVINPNGVVFGQNANVNVGGLVASTGSISDDDFVNGAYSLTQDDDKEDAKVINRGSITARDGGLVALVAPGVENSGVINAQLGTAILGSGKSFTLDMSGDELISFDVTGQTGSQLGGIVNSGQIQADGGRVILSADVAKDVVDHAINTSGTLRARSVGGQTGRVLVDGKLGSVQASGNVDVTGEKGGKISVFGDVVNLVSGLFDASGDTGGGTVTIGGDIDNKDGQRIATYTKVGKDAVIDVSANDNGDAGQVAVWSDQDAGEGNARTIFNGTIRGEGGVNGGKGGYASVSSFNGGGLGFVGDVDLSARATGYSDGLLFLDPGDFTIYNENENPRTEEGEVDSGELEIDENNDSWLGSVLLSDMLNSQSMELAAGNTMFVLGGVVWDSANSLTLNGTNVNVQADIANYGSGNITLGASNNVQVTGNVITGSGNIRIAPGQGGAFIGGDGVLNTANGFIEVDQTSAGSLQNAVQAIGSTGAKGAYIYAKAGQHAGDISINQSRIGIIGEGSGSSIILGGISVNGVDGINIDNVGVSGSGIVFNGGSGTVQNSRLFDGGGVAFNGTNGAQVFNTEFLGVTTTAIGSTGSTGTYAYANVIDGASGGIDFDNNAGGEIAGNQVKNAAAFGIRVNGSPGMRITSNIIDTVNGPGITVNDSQGTLVEINNLSNLGGDGIYVDNGSVRLMSNSITGAFGNGIYTGFSTEGSVIDSNIVDGGATGIANRGYGSLFVNNEVKNTSGDGYNSLALSEWITFKANRVLNVGGDGFDFTGTTYATDNTVVNAQGLGMSFSGGVGNNATNNYIENVGNGIAMQDVSPGNLIFNNQIFSYRGNGIDVSNSGTTLINSNDMRGASGAGIGIRVLNSEGSSVHSNSVTGGRQGIVVEGSNHTFLIVNNIYNATGIGITVDSSFGAELSSNSVIDSGETGILLNNSSGTLIDTNTVRAGYTGIAMTNGGGNRIINNVINAQGNGIDVENTGREGAFIHSNQVVAGGNGISLSNAFGSETFSNDITAGQTGVSLTNATENSVISNIINAVTGVFVTQNHEDKPTLIGSNVGNASGDAVVVTNSTKGLVRVEDNSL